MGAGAFATTAGAATVAADDATSVFAVVTVVAAEAATEGALFATASFSKATAIS